MGTTLAAITLLGAFFASLYGWGRLVLPLLYRDPPGTPAFAAALGLVIWTFLGGVLNAAGLAYAPALDTLFISGLLLWLIFLFKFLAARGTGFSPRGIWKRVLVDVADGQWRIGDLVPIGTVLLAGAYLITTVLPADVFNYHDDLRSYFVPPLRMLATGSMSAGTFDLLGPSRFGPQEFFLAFVFARFPLAYANAFDLVFCLVLSGLLVNALGQRLSLHWGYRLAAILALLCIHPQYVNVSSLYSTTAMLLGLIYASLILAETKDTQALGALIPVACFAAASLIFKATVAPFTAGFLILLILLLALMTRSPKRLVPLTGGLAILSGVFVLPWVLALRSDYTTLWYKVAAVLSRAIEQFLGGGSLSIPDASATPAQSPAMENLARIFSLDPLFWGGSFPLYTGTVLFVSVIGVVALVRLWRSPGDTSRAALGVCAAAGLAAGASYLAGAFVYLERPDLVVRYFLPVLIGVLPSVFMLLLADLGKIRRTGAPDTLVPAIPAMLLILGLCVVSLAFTGTLANRTQQLYSDRNMLSFPISDNYMKYNQVILSENTRQQLLEMQAETQPGAMLLAWISLPFGLDYARNPIVALDAAGLRKLGLGLRASRPFEVESERLREHLLERGVRYVMWQYRGYGMRSDSALAARGWHGLIGLKRRFEQLARESTTVVRRHGIVIFDLSVRVPP